MILLKMFYDAYKFDMIHIMFNVYIAYIDL